ncbi:multicopper oxidase domain-containing protein [Methylogaea oryzae]|uniref:multicopper oxidase domain-containing protein n=1 Tax=Methylogaea oryzae TaxID=1295382 RepID=UPI0020D0D771|nr:multicopper oxidase domain-containing protein [Methylogaea oryzae]
MVSHKIRARNGETSDVTSRYSPKPSIPGPAIVMTEGDVAEVTLEQGISNSNQPVSLHVHGVHYKIDSDGTMKSLNGVADEAAFPGKPYTYRWVARRDGGNLDVPRPHFFESHAGRRGQGPVRHADRQPRRRQGESHDRRQDHRSGRGRHQAGIHPVDA